MSVADDPRLTVVAMVAVTVMEQTRSALEDTGVEPGCINHSHRRRSSGLWVLLQAGGSACPNTS